MAVDCGRRVWAYRSTFILILTPIILLPIAVLPPPELKSAFACAYTILLMAVYWVSEVLPPAVTALLPLVFYPILGVLEAKTVSMQYLKDINVLFLGGLTVAVAVEHWNLHKRIALKVLTKVGAKPRWLLFGLMTTTAFLSMWISNVATTAMMIPIAQAVLDELFIEEEDPENPSSPNDDADFPDGGISGIEPHRLQESHLAVEMGNISEARELGARLARSSSSDEEVVEFVDDDNENFSSSPATYSILSREEDFPIHNRQKEKVQIVLTKPDNPTPPITPKFNHSPVHLNVKRSSDASSIDTTTGSHERLLPRPSVDSQMRAFNVKIDRENDKKNLAKALTICVCYSSNIGGTATLTGTGPNLLMAGQFRSTYPNAPEIDFGSWVFFSFPGMLVFLILSWFGLQYLFLKLQFRDLIPCFQKREYKKTFDEQQAESIIKRQYEELGPMSFAEKSVLFLFVLLALLWLTRDPGFVDRWGSSNLFKPNSPTEQGFSAYVYFNPRNETGNGRCGIADIAPWPTGGTASARVIGGLEAIVGSWPWVAMLDGAFCGGTLINDKWVVTAAHCVVPRGTPNQNFSNYVPDVSHITVVLGRHVDGISSPLTEQSSAIERAFVYPGYVRRRPPGALESFGRGSVPTNDIALLRLRTPVRTSTHVKPICLPRRDAIVGQTCVIAGWGSIGSRVTTTDRRDVLRYARLPILRNSLCNSWPALAGAIVDNNICAGFAAGGVDACKGDSGGPLMCLDDRSGSYQLHGIVSWGKQCGEPRQPGIYTRVWPFYDWITGHVFSEL